MKLDRFTQVASIAAALLLVPALLIGLPAAFAQTQPGDTFGLGDILTASTDGSNYTGI
jgi:hypothetical protein